MLIGRLVVTLTDGGFKDLVQVDGGEIGRYIPTGWPLVVS